MNNKIQYYVWFLKTFLLEKEEYSEKLYEEYKNQIFTLQTHYNEWELTQKQIRATVYMHLCMSRKRLALEGSPKYLEDAQSAAGIKCLMETTSEQGICEKVLLEIKKDLQKEEYAYLR